MKDMAESSRQGNSTVNGKREMPVRIRIADPAGNITIFVLDRFDRADYARVASELLSIDEIGAEQVAFVTGERSMEMCGLEFCGNASRAFALMCAESAADADADAKAAEGGDADAKAAGEATEDVDTDAKAAGERVMTVDVSGAEGPVEVLVRPADGFAKISMPAPESIDVREDLGGILVDLGGIMHLVLEDEEASDEKFDALKKAVTSEKDAPAFGVMFLSGEKMTPVVYVKDVDSIYYEGSCASGMTAVMAARYHGEPDGTYSCTMQQPGGVLSGSVTVSGSKVTDVSIEGPVALSEEQTVYVTV